MKIKNLLLVLFLGLGISSCVKEFQPELDKFENSLVVDGMITNESGPYTIRLFTSANVDIIDYNTFPNAEVTLEEEGGISEVLTQTASGVYESDPNGIQGEVGKRYRLKIKAPDGRSYESEYEELKNPTEITSIDANFDYRFFEDVQEEVPGIQFYVNTAPSTNEEDYFLWLMEGTYKYTSSMTISFIYEGSIQPFPNPDSLSTCWNTYRVKEIATETTTNLESSQLSGIPLHFLRADNKRLKIRYSLLTKQFSISKPAFDFWNSIKNQVNSSGSLYSSQPYQVKGNVVNTADPSEPVLGYFLVAGVTEKRIFLNEPEEIDIFIADCEPDYEGMRFINVPDPNAWPIYITEAENGLALGATGCMDCRELGGTIIKPDFWID